MKIKAGELRKLYFVADFPATLDMREKAAQTVQLQKTIADIFAGLLAHQIPLELAVSIAKGPANLSIEHPGQKYNVTVYWRILEGDPDIHIFKDLILAKRCLECADFLSEGHICQFSNPHQSPDASGEDENPDEVFH